MPVIAITPAPDAPAPPLTHPPLTPPEIPLVRLEAQIYELTTHLAAGTCRWLVLVEEFDSRKGWADQGMGSCAGWLSANCGLGPNAARDYVKVARALVGLPAVRAAFSAGRLTYSKVRALVRFATSETEADLVLLAERAPAAQLERIARGRREPAKPRPRATPHARRFVTCRQEPDGDVALLGRLPGTDGALFLSALEAFASAVGSGSGPGAREAGAVDTRTAEQIEADNADLLVRMVRAALRQVAAEAAEEPEAPAEDARPDGAAAETTPDETAADTTPDETAADTARDRTEDVSPGSAGWAEDTATVAEAAAGEDGPDVPVDPAPAPAAPTADAPPAPAGDPATDAASLLGAPSGPAAPTPPARPADDPAPQLPGPDAGPAGGVPPGPARGEAA